MKNMISMSNITKTYHLADLDVPILKKIDLSIAVREYVAIIGGFRFWKIHPYEYYWLSRSTD